MRINLRELFCNVFVEDFLHGQGDDDFVAALEKRVDFRQGVGRKVERHEKAFVAILAHHHGFKGVDVRATGLVLLFHLDNRGVATTGCAGGFLAMR